MEFISHTQAALAAEKTIGGKARNLFRLCAEGLPVPSWVVIPQESLLHLLPKEHQQATDTEIISSIQSYPMAPAFIEAILAQFPKDSYFAVRSSALEEDGATHSFAGLFESYLYVSPEDLAQRIKDVWCSAFSERVHTYKEHHQLQTSRGIAVIVQEMIAADRSGVAFGMNPANGERNAKVINAVYGLGEGLVSGTCDGDQFILKDHCIETHTAIKTEQIVFDAERKSGTKTVTVPMEQTNCPCLSEAEVHAISQLLDRCYAIYGQPQDIEFAWNEGEIYLLQSRPVTQVKQITDQQWEYVLWDNSNIIESYPGITTPLTFSFISSSYEGAYAQFSQYMGVDKKTIRANAPVFRNTLGLLNGRVYYNLKTWYQMLSLLPGYRLNAGFMEKMMGVKERFKLPPKAHLSRNRARWQVLKMMVQTYWRFITLPRKRKAFMRLLETTITHYKAIDYRDKEVHELMQLYRHFEHTLLNEWKAPLLNDFFAMIWFGLLQKRCAEYSSQQNPNLHNDLLCGSSDIISVQPIHRSMALAQQIAQQTTLRELFLQADEKTIWKTLSKSQEKNAIELRQNIDRYLADFGERCMGELKLETISYNQDPTLLIKILKNYVERDLHHSSTNTTIEASMRGKAEQEMATALKGRWLRQWRFRRCLKHARDLVSWRENLRYERTRAFGIVRELFSHIGKKFYAEHLIEHPRDIFYLGKEEIFAFIEGRSLNQDLRALIVLRKKEYEGYRQQPAPVERFASYGMVYHANDFYSDQKLTPLQEDLKGIGCCPGRVRARILVIHDPHAVSSLDGDILVTSSTDPGWVTLFPGAAGIITERGSLLSHSAIVAREMGKPCIVGVTGLLRCLKSGDEIEMDGSTGAIRLLKQAS